MANETHDPNAPSPAAEEATTPETPARRSTRRRFLGAAGATTVGAAVASRVNLVRAQARGEPSAERGRNDAYQNERQRRRATQVRIDAAWADYQAPVAPQPTNGDEERYANKIGTDTRGLPHDDKGEVDPAAWALAARAYASRDPADFEKIPLGGTRKQVNPLGTLASSLLGVSAPQIALPPAPALASGWKATEAVELYWKALLRDVPFHAYESHPDVHEAADELSSLPDYAGPKRNGRVTPDVLFRGSVTYVDPRDPTGRTPKHVIPPGVLEGPYLSQLILRDIPYGGTNISGLFRVPVAAQENDFLTSYDEWLAVQNGAAPKRSIKFDAPRRIFTGRDLAEWSHGGAPSFWGAALLLSAAPSSDPSVVGGLGAPLSPTNPYLKSKTQAGGSGSFAIGHLQGLLALAGSYAIRVEYWQKWFVHRHLRPEAYGGLLHGKAALGRDYPIHEYALDSVAVARTFSKFGTYLLPHAYPEGAPIHSSYPGGNASVSSIGATLLKAFFDESYVIPNPVQPDPRDPTKLIPYEGPPLTLGGELNKLALNSAHGRGWAGIHARSDSAAAFAAGEQVAISILRNERKALIEPFEGFTFTKFDGTKVTV